MAAAAGRREVVRARRKQAEGEGCLLGALLPSASSGRRAAVSSGRSWVMAATRLDPQEFDIGDGERQVPRQHHPAAQQLVEQIDEGDLPEAGRRGLRPSARPVDASSRSLAVRPLGDAHVQTLEGRGQLGAELLRALTLSPC